MGNIADTQNGRIRRVNQEGLIKTVAGGGSARRLLDGMPAIEAKGCGSARVEVGPDGSFYLVGTDWGSRIVSVGPDGLIATVAGPNYFTMSDGYEGDAGPSVGPARLYSPLGLALSPQGDLYVADNFNHVIRQVTLPFPGFGYGGGFGIPSEDGSLLYQFDPNGRHLHTVNALNGAILYDFTYNEDGLLTAVEDGDGDITTIERDTDENPTAIVAPFGQRTDLSLDSDGYLSTTTDPAGNAYRFTYVNDGLLQTFTNPRTHTSSFAYDAQGRLIKDEDPAGGYTDLARTDGDNSYTVTMSTAENRVTSYQMEALSTGKMRRFNTYPDGAQKELVIGRDEITRATYADSTVINEVQGPDPRFGMQAPLIENLAIDTPGGLKYYSMAERTVTLNESSGPFNLETLTNTVNINGRTFTSTYDADILTWTGVTPEGRQTVSIVDDQGRPLEIQIADLESFTFSYDAHGRLEQVAHGIRQSQFVYDTTTGYLKNSANPLGDTTFYARDALGRVTGLTLPDMTVWGYAWDEVGNLITLTEPDGATQHQFTYTSTNLSDSAH